MCSKFSGLSSLISTHVQGTTVCSRNVRNVENYRNTDSTIPIHDVSYVPGLNRIELCLERFKIKYFTALGYDTIIQGTSERVLLFKRMNHCNFKTRDAGVYLDQE